MTNDNIIHQGKVVQIDKNSVFVRIEQKVACGECHAVSVCFVANKNDKIIEVSDCSGSYAIQEEVLISARSSMGLFAAAVAYTIPLLTVVIAVVAGIYISKSEVIGGLAGLLILVAYYFILFLLRDKIKKNVHFTLSKKSN